MTGRVRLPVLALGLVSVALGATLAWRIATPADTVSLPAVTAPANLAPVAAPAPFAPPDPQQFAEVSSRPLFRPDRRPARVEPPPPPRAVQPPPPSPPPPAPPQVALLGIMLGPAASVAVVRLQGTAVAHTVAVGDDVQGWRVEIIDADHMVLRLGSQRHDVPLRPRATPRPGEGLIVHPAPATARTSQRHRHSGQRSLCARRRNRARR